MGRWFKRFVGIGVVLAAAGVVLVRVPALQDVLIRREAARRLAGTSQPAWADGALRVLLCGTASPMPHPTRAKACVAVFAGERFWIVDTGPGSWNRLGLWQIDGRRVGGILLTHFHSDHIGDLGEFNLQTWVAGRPGPLAVYGGPGVERVVNGFSEAYALDNGYRTAHHGADIMVPAVGTMEAHPIAGPAAGAGPTVVVQEDGLTITAFAVDHAPIAPAYGYRFDYRGRSVVVSGDTVKSAGLIAAARGADVLVHEAQANHLVDVLRESVAATGRPRLAKILGDIPSYHTSPIQAAEAANEAGVRLLVFYHLTPPPPAWIVEQAFIRGVANVRPRDWVLGDDGMLITLPADSTVVTAASLD
jgi:ribonuclease Z